jgi:hypothetical protein
MSPVTLVVIYLLEQENTSNTKENEVFQRLVYHVHRFYAYSFLSDHIVKKEKDDRK